MNALLYFAIWAGLIFLMMRFGCGRHIMGGGHSEAGNTTGSPSTSTNELRWSAPESAIDPVCDKTVYPANAKTSVYDGYVYYFCSSDCRDRFEAAPETYVGNRDGQHPQLEYGHG